ncbi:MAG TPA: ATP-binding protein [Acidobacteriaceae bacterium]|nr:ATP-binding protein [Acidobacteriaceae bacterium]
MTTQANSLAIAPPDPARVPEIVAALQKVVHLQGLEPREYEWLARHATEVFAEAGTVIFHDGDQAHKMTILLKGEIHVRRERGGPASLFIGRSGQITGLMPFSRMKTYGGQGYAATAAWALEFDKSLFPEMLAAIPSFGQRCVGILLDRTREITRMEQQSEKLNALGKLAGNLAHELNNPASAAQRAAAGMLEELRVYGQERFDLGKLCLPSTEIDRIAAWEAAVQEKRNRLGDATVQAPLEDAVTAWLQQNGVGRSWKIAPELAECGISTTQLDQLKGSLESGALTVVLSQFASSLRAERIAEAMLNSTARIFDLIRAIKDYSYMDQAPIQEIDIPQSLENTLAMVASRLQNVEIIRDYEPNLPTLSAYGSELNQVWTALIENALDAIGDRGQLKLSVRMTGDLILTEISDNGPGVPEELQARIFEPFFTTKAPGAGLGLGLDTVNRVVRMHRGFVSVQSKPGRTCFQVRLPVQQLQAY